MMLMMCFKLLFMIIFFLVIFQYWIEEKQYFQENSLMSIEAGFEKLSFKAYMSTPYFLMIMLYVLFDVELIIMFPILMESINTVSTFSNINILLFIVMGTLMMEWSLTGLTWVM